MDLTLLITLVGLALVIISLTVLFGPWALLASGCVLTVGGLLVDPKKLS